MADHQQQQHLLPASASASASASTSEPRCGLSLSMSSHQSSQPLSSTSRSARSNKPILSPAGRPCLICFDKEKDGVECELGHFLCRGCLRGFIANLEPLQVRTCSFGVVLEGGRCCLPAIHINRMGVCGCGHSSPP